MKSNANAACFPMYVIVKSIFSDGKQSRGMVRDYVTVNGKVETVTARFKTRADAQKVAADCEDGQLNAFGWYALDSHETGAARYAAKHVNRLPRLLRETLQDEQSRKREREEEFVEQAERPTVVEYEAKRRAPIITAEAGSERLGVNVSL